MAVDMVMRRSGIIDGGMCGGHSMEALHLYLLRRQSSLDFDCNGEIGSLKSSSIRREHWDEEDIEDVGSDMQFVVAVAKSQPS